jgi:hypothetical protein
VLQSPRGRRTALHVEVLTDVCTQGLHAMSARWSIQSSQSTASRRRGARQGSWARAHSLRSGTQAASSWGRCLGYASRRRVRCRPANRTDGRRN